MQDDQQQAPRHRAGRRAAVEFPPPDGAGPPTTGSRPAPGPQDRCAARPRGAAPSRLRRRPVRRHRRARRGHRADRRRAMPAPRFGLAGAPTGRRVRARLARFNAPWQTPSVSEVLEPLIAHAPGQPPQGRHPAAAARLRHGRALRTRGSTASPATRTSRTRSRSPPSSPTWAWTPRRWSRRCCTTRSRTPTTRSSGCAGRLRRRGHAPRRRRHQARQGQARRRGEGRDDPQDGRRDGQGPAGARHQARRPAAQHADPDLPAPPQAGAEGQGDPGDPGARSPTGSA